MLSNYHQHPSLELFHLSKLKLCTQQTIILYSRPLDQPLATATLRLDYFLTRFLSHLIKALEGPLLTSGIASHMQAFFYIRECIYCKKSKRKWGWRERRGGDPTGRGPGWARRPQASAALPRIRPILSHQEVDLASHFHVVDPPAVFVALPLSPATRLLVVPPALDVLDEPVHSENPVQRQVMKSEAWPHQHSAPAPAGQVS